MDDITITLTRDEAAALSVLAQWPMESFRNAGIVDHARTALVKLSDALVDPRHAYRCPVCEAPGYSYMSCHRADCADGR